MASKKKSRKPSVGRKPAQFTGERGGARYNLRPIEATGGGTMGGLLTPSGQGQVGV
jgi:hypothetical protein